MELPDGADVFAEAGAAEQRVDHEGADEVGDDDPRGPERAVPQCERLVGPEEERQQNNSQPLRSQRVRPVARGKSEPASELARQHERARHAEHVAHREQSDDDEEAPVGPRQHAGEIHRRHLIAQQPVGDDHRGHHEKDALQHVPAVSCAQECTDERYLQQIERRPGLDWPQSQRGFRARMDGRREQANRHDDRGDEEHHAIRAPTSRRRP